MEARQTAFNAHNDVWIVLGVVDTLKAQQMTGFSHYIITTLTLKKLDRSKQSYLD